MHFTLSKYSASQVSSSAFTLTLETNYESSVADVQAEWFLRDASGNHCHMRGVLSGATLTRTFIHESSEADDRMPTFGSGLYAHSVLGGVTMRERGLGMAIIGLCFQSNTIGTHISSKGAQEFADPNVLEWLDAGYTIVAEDPLEHQSTPRTDSFGYGIHLAKLLKLYEGYNKVCIVAAAHGGTGFAANNWNKGDPEYNHFINKLNAAIASHPHNQFVGLFGSIGEDDSWGDIPGSVAAFPGALNQFVDDVRADIVLNPIQGSNWSSRFPIVLTEMAPAYVASGADPLAVNNSIKDLPNQRAYTGVANSDGLTSISGETYHFDGDSIRQQPARIYSAWLAARNNDAPGGPVDGTITGGLTITASALATVYVPPITAAITGGLTIECAATATSGNITTADIAGGLTIECAATATVTDSTAEMSLRQGTGITEDANGISTWADQVNSNDATQSTNAEKPNTDASGNVVFIRANNEKLEVPQAMLNGTNGHTIVARIRTSSTAGNQNILSTNQHAFYVNNSTGSISGFLNNNLTGIPSGTTAVNDGAWHDVAISVTNAGVQKIIIDGTEESSKDYGSYNNNSTRAIIGAFWNASPANHFDGDMQRVEVFTEVLTASEISAITAGW